ncbi:muconolactone Delta-isomerase [Arthrobacter cavernae]|uniref:Muconolactone Delta-isomerase n=1 Tax=Arthrobacter cavernae TaxID=2817681 RepID=A0A939HDS8_9MICC|nr:muconolactone Delta-isomerase [Arthrobacter cavernae]MBO1267996.1 muconolactone Delta-isomerase [Arthrobacter cavernae]
MLFLVRMDVNIPLDMPQAMAEAIKAKERDYSQALQRKGRWRHLWRVVGEYSNYSVFDVADNDELHTVLSGLPLFPYMDIKVTPLAQHPSAVEQSSNGNGAVADSHDDPGIHMQTVPMEGK